MPPSGYSQPAVNGLESFFSQTLKDLRTEVAEGKHASFEAGCTFEIGQIEKVLAGKLSLEVSDLEPVNRLVEQQVYTRLVLAMTLAFYRRVLAVGTDIALAELIGEVSAIHIDDAGNLTYR